MPREWMAMTVLVLLLASASRAPRAHYDGAHGPVPRPAEDSRRAAVALIFAAGGRR